MWRIKSILLVSIVLLVMTGCGTAQAVPSPSTTAPSKLALLQQNGFITARLYGVATFDFEGQDFAWPMELFLSSVPIVWTGQVFNGGIEKAGPAEDMIDVVHGGVSADGEWLLNFSYSRRVLTATGEYYRVDLKNVPILVNWNDTSTIGVTFKKAGDIEKYVTSIVYLSGGMATFKSMDWTSELQGQQAVLNITFEQEPSLPLGAGQPPVNPC